MESDSLAQAKTSAAWLGQLFRNDWVVMQTTLRWPRIRTPISRPLPTHRVAISNHRLVSLAEASHLSLARLCSKQRTKVAFDRIAWTSSCAASYWHLLPKGPSYVSATSVSWPAGDAPLFCRFA